MGFMICTVNAEGTHVAADVPAPLKVRGDGTPGVYAVGSLIGFAASAAVFGYTAQMFDHSPAMRFPVSAPVGNLNVPNSTAFEDVLNRFVVRTTVYGPTGRGSDR